MPSLPRRAALRSLLAATLTLGLAAAPAVGQSPTAASGGQSRVRGDGTTLVLLVRHGEKAAAPADDPPLTEAGLARAQALRAALADAGVQHVIATPRRRTGDTARPLAQALGLTPELVPLSAGATHVAAVADAVRRHAGEVVLVVGHSNTVPAIVGALRPVTFVLLMLATGALRGWREAVVRESAAVGRAAALYAIGALALAMLGFVVVHGRPG